jgi:hypothetical protein
MKTFNLRLVSMAALVAVAVLAGPAVAWGQGLAEGSIIGRVVDQTKAVLPGVTVTATNLATGFQRTSVTEGDGVFRLVALPPAEYEVSAELSGFSTVRSRVVVTVASETNIELGMSVATLTESVTVTGEAPLIEVTQTQQAVTINQTEIEGLPTNSRNFLEFALLSPGVVRGRSGGAGFGGENGFSTSGNRGDQNGINIDGVSNKSLDNGLEQTTFSSEGVQEFNVVTQGYPAEFGGAAGGVINAVSKSGTNNFNGYGYGFIRSDAFDKPVFNTVTGSDGIVTAEPASQAAEFNRSVTGLTIGGPIRQDQMFFFGLAEITRSNTPRLENIVQATLDSVRQIAIPDLPDTEANVIRQFKPRNNKGNVKVDWNLSNTQNVSVRGSYNSNFNPAGAPNGRNSVTTTTETKDRTFVIAGSLNSVPSNRFLNTARFMINREDSWVEFPMQGGRENMRNFSPRIQIGGNTGGMFGRGNGGGGEHNFETKWEFNDTVTMYRDSHTFKMGGDYLFSQFQQINNYGPDGVWDFSDINAFRAGLPTAFFQTWGHGGVYLKVHYFSGFAQDQWQPRPGLTIEYGVRYQYDHHPNDIASYTLPEKIFNPMTLERTDEAGSPGMKGFNNDNNNIMPRLGVAWTPDQGKTLFRAAGGSFYGIQYLGEIANPMGWNGPPSSYRFTFSQVEAREIWAGTVNPASPFYNPLGIRRLPYYYYDRVLVPQGIPPTNNVFDTDLKTPMSWQANFGVDRQLTQRVAVSGSFLWSRGYNNIRNVNKNPQGGVAYSQGALLPSGRITPFDVIYRQGPRPDSSFSEVWTYGNYGTMKFKGATGSISSRWTNLQLRASVTWNDSWDDSVAISFRQGPSNPDCVPCEWSRSVTNSTRFVGSVVYMTPQTRGVFGRDWQVATIFEYEGGHPYQVLSGFDTNNDTIAADRPLGVPRNSLITDPYKNVDFRFSRTLPVRGDVKVEVLFELFNAFNWANYSTYVDSLYVLQGGQYVPRPDFVAFQASPNLNVLDTKRDPGEIGLDPKQRRNGVGDPMRGQLGFRFRF